MKIMLITVLVLAVFTSAIGIVFNQHQARKLFIEIQELERQRDDLDDFGAAPATSLGYYL